MTHKIGPTSVVVPVTVINLIRETQRSTAWQPNGGHTSTWADAWTRANIEDRVPKGVQWLYLSVISRRPGSGGDNCRVDMRPNGSTIGADTREVETATVRQTAGASDADQMAHAFRECDADGIVEYQNQNDGRAFANIWGYILRHTERS